METRRIITQQIETEEKMCPSFQALDMVMDKWTPKVLFLLQEGPLRYMQLKRQAGGSTQKMVTQTLRKLEKEGWSPARSIRPRPRRWNTHSHHSAKCCEQRFRNCYSGPESIQRSFSQCEKATRKPMRKKVFTRNERPTYSTRVFPEMI